MSEIQNLLLSELILEYKKDLSDIPQNRSDNFKRYLFQECVDKLVDKIIFRDPSKDLILYNIFARIAAERGYSFLTIMFYNLDMEEQEEIFKLVCKITKLVAFI